jgi:hypothetical protein
MVSPPRIVDYYILIHRPKHPRALDNGYVPEHYLVAEKELGRYLTPDEEVRHKSENTQDNRPSNLEVISINADYRSQGLGNEDFVEKRRSTRNSMPCKFQRPCWKEIRAPLAKKNHVFLPYICSFQTGGDIYKCSHFWGFLEKEEAEKKESNL